MNNNQGEKLVLECGDISSIEEVLKKEMQKHTEFSETLWMWWSWVLGGADEETGVTHFHPLHPQKSASRVCGEIYECEYGKKSKEALAILSAFSVGKQVSRYLEFYDHEELSPWAVAREFAEEERIKYLLVAAIETYRDQMERLELQCPMH